MTPAQPPRPGRARSDGGPPPAGWVRQGPDGPRIGEGRRQGGRRRPGPGRGRVRPRRIPGAPGSVLVPDAAARGRTAGRTGGAAGPGGPHRVGHPAAAPAPRPRDGAGDAGAGKRRCRARWGAARRPCPAVGPAGGPSPARPGEPRRQPASAGGWPPSTSTACCPPTRRPASGAWRACAGWACGVGLGDPGAHAALRGVPGAHLPEPAGGHRQGPRADRGAQPGERAPGGAGRRPARRRASRRSPAASWAW